MPAGEDRAHLEPLELWGGVECTVNRVGDEVYDQLVATGHCDRIGDLHLIAGLGIRTLRYPVLWERHDGGWSWADERLERLRELGIRPIVGLTHHGSGPPHLSLVDPDFAPGLAEFAHEVAERYPWVDLWTPVNEPNTTARFSGLYGLWHPHARDALAYGHVLTNQCRAVVLAMEAIRSVNPGAQLVQTEDLSKTHSTPALAHQAAHENERRWVTFDLLCGRLGPETEMWRWLAERGFPERELGWFLERNCPPDLLGLDHYLSAERFLDERVERYPGEQVGGNGVDVYVDVLASRVLGPGADGPERLAREAWDRYGIPLAFTEAHNGCTREEQLRWLHELWGAARNLRADGVDLRAVTVWSLFGGYGWDKMLTAGLEAYEPGVFDLRAKEPRPTALATMAHGLATRGEWDHPTLPSPGWWRRPERLWYPPEGPVAPAPVSVAPPLLVSGVEGGAVRQALALAARARGLEYRLGFELDTLRPWAVVDPDGSATLAHACVERDLPLLSFADDPTRVLAAHPGALVVRGVHVDEALNLLIDGASGVWALGSHGAYEEAAFVPA
jgi:dTDP-4-dehydrorhamnose reductase